MTDTDNEGRGPRNESAPARILDDNGTLVTGAAPEASADAPPAYVDKGNIPDDDGSSDGLGGVDAGSPGGMGGTHASGGTGNGRPPGGISPVQIEQATRGDVNPDD